MKTSIGILAQKINMTQIPNAEGIFVPVTVVTIDDNWIAQVKTKERDGYNSCQLAFQICSKKNLNKPQLGHLKKYNITPKKHLCEIRDMVGFKSGSKLDTSIFTEGEKIKVSGFSKGKGFAGVIKRYGQKRGPMSHGSGYHRGVGSLSSGLDNNRVLKGKKMPGRMGHKKVTISNLIIEKILPEKQIILIRGNVPGPRNNLLILSKRAEN
jgi:large subunit ribosomal protein L3